MEDSNNLVSNIENTQIETKECTVSNNEQTEPDGSVPGTRSRKPTERGLEFKRDLAEREFKTVIRNLRKQSQNAESAIADSIDIGYLIENRKTLETNIDRLSIAYDDFAKLLESHNIGRITEQHEQSYQFRSAIAYKRFK